MTRRRIVCGIVPAIALAAWMAGPAAAVIHLKRGMEAPAIALPDLDGEEARLEDFGGRTVVLLFGELFHEKTLSAYADIQGVLDDDRIEDRSITPLLIVGQNAPREALAARAADADLTWRILHDENRRAFGAYRVAVIPSVVVVDGAGRIVHAQAGYIGRFKDVSLDAMLVSEGLLSAEQFDKSLDPAAASAVSPEQTRAVRLTSLARQLVRRGLPEVAEEKYVEALETVPTYAPARIGLGILQLQRGRLAEAELEFRTVLISVPKSVDARLGLAYVQVLRGGAEVAEAETTLRGVLSSHPSEPRAHYLMGLLHQQRSEIEEAAASFRTAAEHLMSQRGAWDVRARETPG